MNHREQDSHGQAGALAVLLLLVLPLLYVLLLGPAVRWHDDCPSSVQTAIEIVYAPVVWLHSHTWLGPWLERYVALWEQ